MRRLLFASLALFATFDTASAQERWLEASVTLTLTLSSTGEEETKPGKNATSTVSAPLQRSRFGNTDILAALVDANVIPESKGWRLVARWRESEPDSDDGYRFYVVKGRGYLRERITVPAAILLIEPLDGAVGVRHTVNNADANITKGSEKREVLNRLTFETSELAGVVSGILTGAGRYIRPATGYSARYSPTDNKAVLQGIHYAHAEDRYGVANGSISFGTSEWIGPPASNGGSGPLIDIGVDDGGGITVSVN